MSRLSHRVGSALAAVLVLTLSACGGGGDSAGPDGGPKRITVWTGDTLPDRVDATKKIIEKFTAKTGIQVELVGVDEDQFNQTLTSAAAAGTLPDVIGSQPLASVRTLAANELVDTAATGEVVAALGADTFDQRALELTRDGDAQLAVPSDAWAQLLYYRKDLFDAAGLPAPTTYDAILQRRQDAEPAGPGRVRRGHRGRATRSPSRPSSTSRWPTAARWSTRPARSPSPARRASAAFTFYRDLITDYSVPGAQDVDTVRATYFAGQAAMIVWSTYLLDELAGLRNDALPSCPECTADPRFLATNTGIVTGLQGPDGAEPAQFGEITSWAIPVDADADSAKQFVQFMLSDGYVDWLAIAPEGKFPVRHGAGRGQHRVRRHLEEAAGRGGHRGAAGRRLPARGAGRAAGRAEGVHPVGHHPGPGRPDRGLAGRAAGRGRGGRGDRRRGSAAGRGRRGGGQAAGDPGHPEVSTERGAERSGRPTGAGVRRAPSGAGGARCAAPTPGPGWR